MLHSNLPEPEILKILLEPLLEDFQYWFGRARSLLEDEAIAAISVEEQFNLLEQVIQAQQEVSAAQSLFRLTDGQVGIETGILMSWHKLVTQCWQVMVNFRLGKSSDS